jgi:hypothetical protein
MSPVLNFMIKILNFAAKLSRIAAKILNFMKKVNCLTFGKQSPFPIKPKEINKLPNRYICG